MTKLKIKKGDNVMVITGDDKGKTGRVLEVYPKERKLLVEQINIHSKHTRPNQQNQKGGIVKKEIPVDYSNVMMLDQDKKPTRIGIRRIEDKNGKQTSVRFARSNNKDL